MRNLKGKNTFTLAEIRKIEELIKLRIITAASGQKSIRQKMRNIGFYGRDDWGINDMQLSDLKRLIDTGKIKVLGGEYKPTSEKSQLKSKSLEKEKQNEETPLNTDDTKSVLSNLEKNIFDPYSDSELKISNAPGNYIICLKKKATLPEISIKPILTKFKDLEVIYTGIAGTSLRTRDFKQHFEGNNAGRSTLRKSLGSLFGYKQIPRDKDPNTGKTKFNESDEYELSVWMKSNLVMYFYPNRDFNAVESILINKFNPPLNLQGNNNIVNADYRKLLSNLRNRKYQ